MDAKALLEAQGWRGRGHTLHATDDTMGLIHPLLLSRKTDRLGLGCQSAHDHAAATDQWWLNAFDQHLKGLAPGGKASADKQPSTLSAMTGNWGASKYTGANGLYNSFVWGGILESTILEADDGAGCSSEATPESEEVPRAQATKTNKKRKRHDLAGEEDASQRKKEKREKRERKGKEVASADDRQREPKKDKKRQNKRRTDEESAERVHHDSTGDSEKAISKEARKSSKEIKAARKAQKAVAKQRKAEEKKRTKATETKDERRIRRVAKRIKKAEKRAQSGV